MNAKRKPYNKAATTATPDDSPVTAKPTTPPPEVQDEIERAIRAGIIPMAATLMDVLPDDETRKALWGCCAKPKHQQPTFTDLMMRNHQPWIAANPKLWDVAYEAEADALDTIFCKNLKAPCNQPPLFRTPLADFYNITETAQPTTAQAADGDAIARKVTDAVGGQLKDIQADTTATALNMATISNGVDFLVQKRKQQIAVNRKRGKDSQRKGDHEEAVRAARDKADALKRVGADPDVKANRHGAVLAACRKLCDWELNGVKHHGRFRPLTSKRNADGSFAEYAPLTDKSGKPIKPETLARQFRDNRGTRKERAKK